jgi:FKBP-type peptidyl-prolyl cis-trans isomerase
MKQNSISMFACCLLLGAALTACKGKTSAPAEGESEATPAEGEAQAAGQPTTVVRQARPARVEVDTAAPASVGVVPEDAQRSDSGLAWVVLKEGTGQAHPAEGDRALLNFIGWTAEGTLVQESLTDGRPASIPIGSMFSGLAEGVQSMVQGEKRRLWIPGKLAFGEPTPDEPPAEDGPPRGMLVYDVELVGFTAPAPAPPMPPKAKPDE